MIDKKILRDWMIGVGIAESECERVEQVAVVRPDIVEGHREIGIGRGLAILNILLPGLRHIHRRSGGGQVIIPGCAHHARHALHHRAFDGATTGVSAVDAERAA